LFEKLITMLFVQNFYSYERSAHSKSLKASENLGAYTGSLHPIQSVADKDSGWKKLYNIYYGFEGCEEALKHALTVVKSFEGKLIKIKEQDKTLYHAAACIISNYTVTLSYVAYKYWKV